MQAGVRDAAQQPAHMRQLPLPSACCRSARRTATHMQACTHAHCAAAGAAGAAAAAAARAAPPGSSQGPPHPLICCRQRPPPGRPAGCPPRPAPASAPWKTRLQWRTRAATGTGCAVTAASAATAAAAAGRAAGCGSSSVAMHARDACRQVMQAFAFCCCCVAAAPVMMRIWLSSSGSSLSWHARLSSTNANSPPWLSRKPVRMLSALPRQSQARRGGSAIAAGGMQTVSRGRSPRAVLHCCHRTPASSVPTLLR